MSDDLGLRSQTVSEDDEIDLMAIARVLWRGKWVIALVCLLFVLAGGYYAYGVATPLYKATARVEFASEAAPVLDLSSVLSGSSTDEVVINTRIENAKSREMMEILTRELNLTDNPEFNNALVPPSRFSPGVLLNRMLVEVGIAERPIELAPEAQASLEFRNTVERVRKSVFINANRKTHIFDITASSKDPDLASQMANTLAEIYIREEKARDFDTTEQTINWLSEQARELENDLRAQEEEFRSLRENTDLISPESLDVLSLRAKEFRERLENREAVLAEQQAKLFLMETLWEAREPEAIVEAFADPTLARLGLALRQDPESEAHQQAFDQRAQQVVADQRNSVIQISNEVSVLRTSFDLLQTQLKEQTADLQKLEQMQRELDVTKDLYKTFLTGLQEATVQLGLVRADTRLMSAALAPLDPVSPRKLLILFTSAMLGAIIAIGLLLIRQFSNAGVRTAADLEQLTGHSVLGQVPSIGSGRRKKVFKYLLDRPTSAAAEAIRNLRTSILLSNIDTPPQVIMSTSSVPGEGKTTQSIALSLSFAGMGKKVLLIEGDLRRRVFSDYFDLNRTQGVISVLSGDKSFDEIVAHEPDMNVDILVGEETSTNAADVYSSDKFKSFLADIRDRYDIIIIDTPPVLAVPDARVIGQSVDAVIYTVRWDSTGQREITDGLKACETANVKVTGLVLGQISVKGMKRYGYGDGHAAYSSYYD